MQTKFSPSTGGFYVEGLHLDIPADAVDILPEEHQAVLLAAQATPGGLIGMEEGRPVAVAAPPPTVEAVRDGLLARIGQRKNQMRDGGFVVPVGGEDVRWDSDTSARLAYAELALRLTADPTFTTRWKASEGQWVNMTVSLFQEVYAAGAAHIAAAFAWQEGEEARLAATPDDQLVTFVVGGEDA